MTAGSGWAVSPSGASSVRGVKRSSPSCRLSSCATARCLPTSPATPCWPHMGASVWSGVRSSAMSPRWRSIASSVRSDNSVLWPCSPGVGCSCVTNFCMVAFWGRLSLSRGGLSREGVELYGRCEGPFCLLDHQLPLLDHVHEFHASQGSLRCRKGLEPQHRTRHPLHGSMVLFDDVVY